MNTALSPAMQEFLDTTMARNASLYGDAVMAFIGASSAEAETAASAPAAPTESTPAEPAVQESEPVEAAEDGEQQESDPDNPAIEAELIEALTGELEADLASDPPLGEAGQRAYERVKAERTSLKAENDQLKAQIETLKASPPSEAAQKSDKADKAKGQDDSTSELSQIKAMLAEDALVAAASAAGFANPALISRLVDVPFKGIRVDREALGHALDDLAAENPGLLKAAPAPKAKAKGSAGRGQQSTTDSTSAAQLTFAQAAKLSPEQLAKASAEGRTRDIYSGRGA